MNSSRLIPITIAGVICFFTAFLLGAGLWYFFGSNNTLIDESQTMVQTEDTNAEAPNVDVENTNQTVNASPTATPEIKKAPAGEIAVTAGVVTLGGGNTILPLRRVDVESFLIGETKVTNQQYAEFLEATGHKPPSDWKKGKFQPRKGDEPVVNVTFPDANEYCAWLSKEIDAEVRLPSEAEWERAARGDTDYKNPWGNKWNDNAAPYRNKKIDILSVKTLPEGRSPFGVYEMVSNIWEWTNDPVVDERNKSILYEGTKQRIVKGGSVYIEETISTTIDAVQERPDNMASELLGFRYIINRQQ